MLSLRTVARSSMQLLVTLSCALSTVRAQDTPKPAALPPHADVSWWTGPDGQRQKIETAEHWQQRRADVLKQMQVVMGPLPQPQPRVPLDLRVEEEATVEGFVRKKVSYCTDSSTRRVRAWLSIPAHKAGERLPAMLCLHQTTGIGKGEPAGLGGLPNLHYALHLVRRGYVTLAPDYPSFGEYECSFPAADGYISGTMRAIFDNQRAVDLLQGLPEVDGERIGCIGHSLGGHNTLFTAAFEPRIKVMVSSCGFTRFHKYYNGALKGWTSPRYMPLINDRYHNNPDEVPFDFPEIVASFAPRPFFTNSPIGDSNFEVSGVRDTMAQARSIYRLMGAEEHLQAEYPDCGHDFPEATRNAAWEFLDKHLKKAPR